MFWAFSQLAEGRFSSYLLPEPVLAMRATPKCFAEKPQCTIGWVALYNTPHLSQHNLVLEQMGHPVCSCNFKCFDNFYTFQNLSSKSNFSTRDFTALAASRMGVRSFSCSMLENVKINDMVECDAMLNKGGAIHTQSCRLIRHVPYFDEGIGRFPGLNPFAG